MTRALRTALRTPSDPGAPALRWVLAALRRRHGPARRPVSTDPFALILYEQVAYLAPETIRRAAFRRLAAEVGLTPPAILNASPAVLRTICRAGGAIAAPLRAERMRTAAELVNRSWNGDLRRALRLPLAQARKALKAFAMIGAPGADRILAQTGAHPVLGLDSNALRVCLRLGFGLERKSYAATYRSVQDAVAGTLPATAKALAEAAALLRLHGETVCRRTAPDCGVCPLAGRCPHAKRRP